MKKDDNIWKVVRGMNWKFNIN